MYIAINSLRMKTDIRVQRYLHTEDTSIGKMYLGDSKEKFCYTLEDAPRGENIKIFGKTAIPAGRYKWKVSMSSRFQREMIMIYSEDNGYELINGGISFKGIRCHGGNTHVDSHGCILTAYILKDSKTIFKTAEKDLTEWAKSVGGEGEFIIENLQA